MTTEPEGIDYFRSIATKQPEKDPALSKSIEEAVRYVREMNNKQETTHTIKFAGQKIE